MDTQVIELLGCNRLKSELLLAGLEVALPMRDRGIDLIAYADLGEQVESFVAYPIQLKVFSRQGFGLHRKYAKFANLILAYVWHLQQPDNAVTYALTYGEALEVAKEMGWTQTASWQQQEAYSTQNPSKKLMLLLEPYKMTPEAWWNKVTNYPQPQSATQKRLLKPASEPGPIL